MSSSSPKEVRFDIYCKKCKHENESEFESPCCDCLAQGWNVNSKKPISFEEKTKNE